MANLPGNRAICTLPDIRASVDSVMDTEHKHENFTHSHPDSFIFSKDGTKIIHDHKETPVVKECQCQDG